MRFFPRRVFLTENPLRAFRDESGRERGPESESRDRAIQNGLTARVSYNAAELIDELSAAIPQVAGSPMRSRPYCHHGCAGRRRSGLSHVWHRCANMLFHVVNDRHRKKRAMIFTTNKPLSGWGRVLHDEDLAHAIVDRILERGPRPHARRALDADQNTSDLDDPTASEALHQPASTPDREVIRISGIEVPEFPEPTRP